MAGLSKTKVLLVAKAGIAYRETPANAVALCLNFSAEARALFEAPAASYGARESSDQAKDLDQ